MIWLLTLLYYLHPLPTLPYHPPLLKMYLTYMGCLLLAYPFFSYCFFGCYNRSFGGKQKEIGKKKKRKYWKYGGSPKREFPFFVQIEREKPLQQQKKKKKNEN
ncbi:hypothetical protein F5X96DRAFT_621636 [Biscogniauxia mediterranea]|nr:hypothetical protein F5X96DRAFT_621636 [Biscogniauxia mediterranea]